MTRRVSVALATALFVATVYLANWLVDRYGPVRVWPTALLAPAGVYVVGLAFVLRDYVQYQGSRLLALAAIAVGTGLSVFVSPSLALASACAFALSESVGLVIFWLAQRWTVAVAVALAGLVAAAVDSYVFLSLAFHSLAFFDGQFVAKVSLSLLAVPLVLGIRRFACRSNMALPDSAAA
jgi:queuosine precursor transporter